MAEDFAREIEWWSHVETLDRVAAILSDNPRVNAELARVEEFNPEIPKSAALLEAKRRVLEATPGGAELWARFAALLESREGRS